MQGLIKHIVLNALLASFVHLDAKADTTNQISLLKLARQNFTNDLSEAEIKMFLATASGEMANCQLTKEEKIIGSNDYDISQSNQWSTNRVIRADRLAWLCTDAEAAKLVNYRGIQINGAAIDGILDLERATLTFALIVRRSVFDSDIIIRQAHLQMLDLTGSQIEGLRADGLKVDSNVILRNKFKANGEIRLVNAIIGGNLDFNNSTLDITKARTGTAINAETAEIDGSVFLNKKFVAIGEVTFQGATIGHNFNCEGGSFMNPADVAINATKAKIEGDVLMRVAFFAEGAVLLGDSTIGHDMDCSFGSFKHPFATALSVSGSKINGSLFMDTDFRAEGTVYLDHAEIGDTLDCGGQYSKADNGVPALPTYAINAIAIKVGGSCAFSPSLGSEGNIDFTGASIGSYLYLRNLEGLKTIHLNLISVKTGILADKIESWPSPGNLLLDGFTYERIDNNSPSDAESRIRWLRLQPTNNVFTQPYEQLARIFTSMGHQDDATEVMVAKNHDYANTLHWSKYSQWAQCFWYKIFGRFIGYGYKTWRAFGLSIVFIITGNFIFHFARRRNLILPMDEKDCSFDMRGNPHLSANYPAFSNFIYSLEMFVPLVKLGMDDNWRPYANRWTKIRIGRRWFNITGKMVRWYLWLHILAGWVLTTLWVGGLTGLVKT